MQERNYWLGRAHSNVCVLRLLAMGAAACLEYHLHKWQAVKAFYEGKVASYQYSMVGNVLLMPNPRVQPKGWDLALDNT